MLYVENSRLHTKTAKTDRWIQQGRRIQDWHTEICYIFYINNEISERESKKKIPFKITSKNKIGINLIREVKDLF